MKPKFNLGRIVLTPKLADLDFIKTRDLFGCLQRHVSGDFGEIGPHRVSLNNLFIQKSYTGLSIISRYTITKQRISIMLVTDDDRESTTIMLTEEFENV